MCITSVSITLYSYRSTVTVFWQDWSKPWLSMAFTWSVNGKRRKYKDSVFSQTTSILFVLFHPKCRFQSSWGHWRESLRSNCSRVTRIWRSGHIGVIIFGQRAILWDSRPRFRNDKTICQVSRKRRTQEWKTLKQPSFRGICI